MLISQGKLDFVYLAPALLCNVALLCGVIPAVFCLNGIVFAYISVGIFLISILLHIYIMIQWQKYKASAPFGYAVVQPVLHMITLVLALAVGATSLCTPTKPEDADFVPQASEMIQPLESISDYVSGD